MKVASSGSCRATSSASRRICAQTGSTLSSALAARTCCWAMIFSWTCDVSWSLAQLPRRRAYMEPERPEPGGVSQRSRAFSEKAEHALLEHLVADRKHV